MVALIWFFARVSFHVSLQIPCMDRRKVTLIAIYRFLEKEVSISMANHFSLLFVVRTKTFTFHELCISIEVMSFSYHCMNVVFV